MHNDLFQPLNNGIAELGLSLSEDKKQVLISYLELLNKWNRTYNLTAIRDLPNMVTLHLLDSLAIAPFIQGQRIIDVGTGAGLPGIPLAVYHPDRHWVLLDSNGKRTRFLTHIKQTLKLENIEIIHERVENYQANPGFDQVISRAFSSLEDMIEKTKHLCSQQGQFLAMKGKVSKDELNPIIKNYNVHVEALNIPNLEAERHLILIDKKGK